MAWIFLAILALPMGRRESAASDWTEGNKSVLFMRVRFADDAGEPISESSARALMDEVDRFIRANSYGATSLTTSVTPLLTLPEPRASQLIQSRYLEIAMAPQLLQRAREVAAAVGYAPTGYDLDCVYLDAAFVGVEALGNIGRKGVWLNVPDVGLACHEFGHNLGLWHANAWRTVDGSWMGPGIHIERGNRFDTMGTGTAEGWHFNAYSKYQLGWLPNALIRTVTTNGIYRIHPSDSPDLTEPLPYALRLRGRDPAREYWVETRQQRSGHPEWRQSLLLYWAPWGASHYGTHLLGDNPRHSGSDDAHLRPGQVFEDDELGLKILPLPTACEDPDAVDVLVQNVRQILLEAEDAARHGNLTPVLDGDASRGACITALGAGRLDFAVNLPSAGHYTLWGRVRRINHPSDSLRVMVDHDSVAPRWLAGAATQGSWEWRSTTHGLPGQPLARTDVPELLSAGVHTITVHFDSPGTALDCLLVTTDLTPNLSPVISSVPPQRTLTDRSLGPIPFAVMDVETPASALRVEAESSNTGLVPPAGLVLGGTRMDRSLTLTPAPGRFGRGTIGLSVVDGDGSRCSTTFEIRVVGPLQARVESCAPGHALEVTAGPWFDALNLTQDVSLLGDPLQPVVLDGGGQAIPLTVQSNTVALVRGFVIRNGWGGAVLNHGVLTLQDCVVLDCQRSLEGTILNHGSLRLERCVLRNNRAANGGGIGNHGVLFVESCTISDNSVSQQGGAICNWKAGSLVLQRSTLSSNRTWSGFGGAIYNAGELFLTNSTISGNTAGRCDPEALGGAGGAIANLGSLTIQSCTVASNRADVTAAGIENRGALVLGDTILAGNRLTDDTPSDGCGSVDSRGFNLIQCPGGFSFCGDMTGNQWGIDPMLAPLDDYGGLTQTHALAAGSAAVDQGSCSGSEMDQRGSSRPYDDQAVVNAADGSDIGASESTPAIDEARCLEAHSPRLAFWPPFAERPLRLRLVGVQPGSVHVLLASTNLLDWWGVATNMAVGPVLEFEPACGLDTTVWIFRTRRL